MSDANQEHALEEKMRFRDLVLQTERFLKYAPNYIFKESIFGALRRIALGKGILLFSEGRCVVAAL
ncbi:MAG: hypothetical protein ACYCPW_07355 [Nitrososphaerales archaeon]